MKAEKSLYEKLESEIESCDWEALADHFERGAILIVDGSLDLAEAGVAMANDDTKTIENWLNQSMITKPTLDDKEVWSQNHKTKFARFLIIQPYVLIQALS